MGREQGSWKSVNRYESHFNSPTAAAMPRYSASAEDRDAVCCFLLRQEMRLELMYIQYPIIDRLLNLHFSQSASLKAVSCMSV